MGKRKGQPRKVKKVKRAVDAAIAGSRALAKGKPAVADGAAPAETRVPECIKRLSSEMPEEREAALQDLTHLVLNPTHGALLMSHNAPTLAANLLANDVLAPIRSAAAAALRNMILAGDETVGDALYPCSAFDLVNGIAAALGAAIDEAAALEANGPNAANAGVAERGEDEEEDEEKPSEGDHHQAHLVGAYKDVEEFLMLATVLAESNDAAAQAMASWRSNGFMTRLMACLRCDGHVEVQQAAAECLKVLSEDSDNVAAFIGEGLDADGKAFLNMMVSSPPASPSLLRVSVNMCGALLNVSATVASVQTVMPVLVAAVSSSAGELVQRLLPLLSNDCSLDPAIRQMGVAQSLDRLRAMQAALQALTDALHIVCEEQNDDLEDEAAFASNAAAAVITESGVISAMVERAAEVMVPPTDPVLRAVLFDPSESGDVATLQRVIASVEVGVLSLTSSFMMLLPIGAFGSLQNMWQLIGSAITSRHDRLNQAVRHSRQLAGLDVDDEENDRNGGTAVSSGTGLLCLPLQLESLAEIAATVQRKDEAGATQANAAHLDVFTRLMWNPHSTPATRSHVIAVVGKIGCRLHDPRCTYSCGNFCSKVLSRCADEAQRAGELTQEVADTAAECIDSVMDLFGDEDNDETTYVPLGLDATIRTVLPLLKRHVQAIRATRRGSASWIRKQHLEEVASNAARFLQYKRENCKAIADAGVGKKYRHA